MLISVITYLLLVVEIVVCLLMIGVVLIQRSKSQGVGLAFGASMGESLFGAQVGNVLTRTTVILAVVFLLNTTALSLLGSARQGRSLADDVPVAAPPAAMPLPGTGTGTGMPDLPAAPPPGISDVPMPAPDAAAAPQDPGAPDTAAAEAPAAVPAPEQPAGE